MSTTPRQLGKYKLHELLGRGGMAEVWKAYDSQLHRYVAIKLLHANLLADPDFVTRFTREARMVAALRHPNIVQIYDFYTPEKNQSGSNQVGTIAYMVMEYIQGQTLADYIRSTSAKKDFLPPVAIVRLFTPISLALDYAHRQGTIHRDIKPANILLDQTNTTHNSMGEPVLSDFGIAKVVGAAGQTMTGSLMGTPLYISPEQVQGQHLTNRSDLYSLAVVLYQILTGVTPFQGEALSALMIKHVMETPPAPHLVNPDLSPAISELLLRALAKDPQQRYPSASAITAAVAQAFNLPVPPELAQAVSLTGDRTIVAGATPRVTLQNGIDPTPASSMPLMSDLETIPPSKSIPNPVTPYP
ncbi:MAG TPA: serine/threonine-protein kinase, partial [Ktedonobacteraceae bacterium]|nr:serine/threonine-protein kinase [Ktedonobacteraceae bacterium]